ncbi:MAG: hypothetical protein U0Q11_14345 [Vicinamibacterales bacterium]
MDGLADLDPIYFADVSWQERFERWLEHHVGDDRFAGANATAIEVIAHRRDLGLRMAVNIAPHALLLFLRDGAYKNAYERASEIGDASPPSATRTKVDGALFRDPDRPEDHYFGAVVLGGTGVRYYGEYCVVLKEDASVVPDDTLVLDRNSYDIVFEPLAGREDTSHIVERLRGRWTSDLMAMVKMKVLPQIAAAPRLTTAGATSELVLHDESFIEVHKRGTFGPDDVHEIRESAADASVEADLIGRRERGHPLSVEESIWLSRRHEVDQALVERGLRARIIVTSGRAPR